jgi:hypothetical protein
MDEDERRRLLEVELKHPDEKYIRAAELWAEYYLACDAFDGGPGPPPAHRRVESNRSARAQLQLLSMRAAQEGIPDETLMEARNAGNDLAARRWREGTLEVEPQRHPGCARRCPPSAD